MNNFEIKDNTIIKVNDLVESNIIISKGIKKTKDKNPINLWRIKYIREEFEESEFADGYPAWYSFNDTTVFEHYDENSNVRVRIDFNNGEFLYYICGASDNWQRLQEVPLEVDYIISALLFRS